MQNHSLFTIYTKRLNHAGIKYLVTGSVAGIIYGEPRLTHDVDLIVFLRLFDLNNLIKEFPENEFYIPPMEVIRTEMSRRMRGHFNIIHHETGFKADIYLVGNDPLHTFAFKYSKQFEIDNENVNIAPPEYVILRKLQYYEEGKSEKHIIDIQAILTNCTIGIDICFIKNNIKSADIKELFNSLYSKVKLF